MRNETPDRYDIRVISSAVGNSHVCSASTLDEAREQAATGTCPGRYYAYTIGDSSSKPIYLGRVK